MFYLEAFYVVMFWLFVIIGLMLIIVGDNDPLNYSPVPIVVGILLLLFTGCGLLYHGIVMDGWLESGFAINDWLLYPGFVLVGFLGSTSLLLILIGVFLFKIDNNTGTIVFLTLAITNIVVYVNYIGFV